MTDQKSVINDENYLPVLDYGFIGIAYEEHNEELTPAVMGNDKSITRAARVSYGKGTKAVQSDRNLIRYLLRHRHTTPFEMAEIKFHAKMPIFVARQWVRHRTANINEYSGRYSVMSDEFYLPEPVDIMPQSEDNKQGRFGEMTDEDKKTILGVMDWVHENTYWAYDVLLYGGRGDHDAGGEEFSEDYPGLARESARAVLPLSNYTEWYWKCDLHNIFRFLSLRMDPHAQYEIRAYADAMYELTRKYFPIATEAFEDYMLKGTELSRMEIELLKEIIDKKELDELSNDDGSKAESYGMSKREWKEFIAKFG